MQSVQPILVAHLFPELLDHLLALLTSLTAEEWEAPTVCEGWSVKDVALHLLGDEVGLISSRRDHHRLAWQPTDSWEELVALINANNELWVRANRRMSSPLLCDFLAHTGRAVCAHIATLDPFAMGVPVSWTGSAPAPVWLDIAREYTERWHHQQHIREAIDRPGLKEPRYFVPVLDTFLRALPYTFHTVPAEEGTVLTLVVTGTAGNTWHLVRQSDQWHLMTGPAVTATTTVTIDQERTWRLLTKGISVQAALDSATIQGESRLGQRVFHAVSIIA